MYYVTLTLFSIQICLMTWNLISGIQELLVHLQQGDDVDADHDGVAHGLGSQLAILNLQQHFGHVGIIAHAVGVSPCAQGAHLGGGLEEIEGMCLPPRHRDDQELPLHAF